ncbi:MAG: T9SS type A sorting domain-containing protein [Bacteroidia bacterium]
MRNLILSFLFLLPLLGLAQVPSIIVNGTVTNQSTGAPINNHTIYVVTDSTATGMFTATAVTNANGTYTATIQFNFLPPTNLGFTVYTYDCNGAIVSLQYVMTSAYTVINNANFQICAGGGGTGCQASFTQSVQNGVLYANNTSTGSTPTSALTYSWSFAGMTSTVQNPSFSLANIANGAYPICLTISDNTGCTSTHCDSVLVNNGGGGSSCSTTFTYNVGTGGVVTLVGTAWSSSGAGCSATYNWTMANTGVTFSTATSATLTLPAGTYTVCLTTTDCNGCVASYCNSFSITNTNPTNYSISGTVAVDSMNSPAMGGDSVIVYLVKYDTTGGGTLTLVQSQTSMTWANPNSPNAPFSFQNLVAGDYLVKAAVLNANSPNYASFMPTYYAYSLFWSSATTLSVPNNGNSLTLHLLPGNNPGGPGFVGGLVSQGANKTTAGLENVQVLLLDMNNNPVAYTYSDANGDYSFSNLAYGTYKIWAEIWGKTTTPIIVTISANNPSATGNEIVVNSTNVTSAIFDNNAYFSGVTLFPNPSAAKTNLKMEMKQSGNVAVEIVNSLGQTVFATREMFTQGSNELAIPTISYPKGIYIVKVNAGEKATAMMKLVVE